MTNNTDPVRALIGEMTEYLDQQVDPELDVIEQWRDRLEAAIASTPPSAPVGVEAVRGAWLAAITLANNICVQESDRENDRDGDTAWIDGTAKCAKRIREYAHPTDAELLEMLDEAGANAAKAAIAQQPAAPEGCGACGDGCANRSGGCRLAEENPPAAPSGEAVAWVNRGSKRAHVRWFGAHEQSIPHGTKLYAAPQQPAAVDGDTVRSVAQHIANAAEYIDKVYPGAETLDAGVILRNMRRWHARLTAALAAQQQGGA